MLEKTNNHTTKEIFKYKSAGNIAEYHVMYHISDDTLSFTEQLEEIVSAYKTSLDQDMPEATTVFVRYFLSDASNQADKVKEITGKLHDCAVSIIEQPPLDGTKIALWVYAVEGISITRIDENSCMYEHGSYRHIWSGSMATDTEKDPYGQTRCLFLQYMEKLRNRQCTLAENCIRTWFFVQNIDSNYKGVVTGRNEIFSANGLTAETHSISSTGIGGRNAETSKIVQFDAYAIKGIKDQQIRYLYAPTHLNPTYEYGVSFERGTSIDYGDRRHVFISGTASIDNKGNVLHKGDIKKQTGRMLENVEVLLQEAGCKYENVGQMIVYLRDISDYRTVKEIYEQRFPKTPKVFLHAPVCRPQWLIEMECIAVRDANNEYEIF